MQPDDRAKPADMQWASHLEISDYRQFGIPTSSGLIDGSGSGFTGQIVLYPTKIAPSGWLVCDGTSRNIADFPDLFQVLNPVLSDITANTTNNTINFSGASSLLVRGDKVMFTTDGTLPSPLVAGTVYHVWDFTTTDTFRLSTQMEPIPITGNIIDITTTGSGTHMIYHTPYAVSSVDDISTVFSLPDYKRRFPIGIDSTSGTPVVGYDVIGGQSGEEDHIHSIAPHNHNLSDSAVAQISIQAGTPAVRMRRVTAPSNWTATHADNDTGGGNSASIGSGAPLDGVTDDSDSQDTETGVYDVMPPSIRTSYIIKT